MGGVFLAFESLTACKGQCLGVRQCSQRRLAPSGVRAFDTFRGQGEPKTGVDVQGLWVGREGNLSQAQGHHSPVVRGTIRAQQPIASSLKRVLPVLAGHHPDSYSTHSEPLPRSATSRSAPIGCVWTRPAAPSLGHPEERPLKWLPLVHTVQYRGRGAVVGDRDLVVRDRCGVELVVEPVLHLGDRKDPHGARLGANTDPAKAGCG